MRCLFRSLSGIFLGLFTAIFLASTVGITPVFAQNDFECGDVCPPPPDQVTFTIRDGSTIISSGSANLPAAGTVSITPTTGGAHNAPARSVLAILKNIESATTTFSVSDLQYSDAFSSFYLNCITAPADLSSPLCGNWQYVVNGVSPSVGMDVQTLSSNDIVYLYFGPSRRITPSSSSVTIGVSFTVLSESYVASSDSWTPAVGLTMRILQGDPFGSPTIISSATTGADGRATFTINNAGSYTAGLAEDFYFPNAAITASATPQPASSPVGGGVPTRPEFDIPLAIAYVVGGQHADGSFPSTLLSDWAAIAFAGGGAGDAQERLRGFFASNPPTLDSITDYERHAMALQALGVNPYSAGGIDYISHIISAFDKTQIGDPALVNDDIFALIPLTHAGYVANDEIIRKITAFIVSKQSANGSWDGSVDMTAAAVQALAPLNSLPNVTAALSSAKDYLHAQQQSDGGFGQGSSNVSSTSWAIQAIYALGDYISNWTKNTLSPIDYLAAQQDRDGSVPKNESNISVRIWATAYAIPAAERKTWDALLFSFSRPVITPAVVQTAATTTTAAVVIAVPIQTEPTNDVLALLDIVVKDQKAPAAPKKEIPALSETATSTEATTTPVRISPQFVQTSAVAIVSSDPIEWLLAVLLLILIAILALLRIQHLFRKRRQSQK
ncbi:MAG: prenyltransferase/squalene oxidase repeat-containing protein [bacterium]|nr:prenyltransferase/squalene oxidase repeat-containing protein [bacterium]